ncbi:serine/threonine-protein phosphatase [Streptomyces sp. AJS327]|uniref:PP2C family serine/threonine-protein phosphatase n=1 Tax=Streptomyces sp. AJS327 TaxID=2545265 RepID=UPI0015E05CF3|nr:PP2C family serine/threonine-protein phosphatase [Streptomyces sp. AJS327]MBA0049801.1 serine/threonine-protein phosphatase [Streptomyces sp. AJS327]
MPQLDQLSACPSCAEPLEPGDRFCDACGTDLAEAARRSAGQTDRDTRGDRPTLPLNQVRLAARSAGAVGSGATSQDGSASSGEASDSGGPGSTPAGPGASRSPRKGKPSRDAARRSPGDAERVGSREPATEQDFPLPPARSAPEPATPPTDTASEPAEAAGRTEAPEPAEPAEPAGAEAAEIVEPAVPPRSGPRDPRTADPRTLLDEPGAPAERPAGQGASGGREGTGGSGERDGPGEAARAAAAPEPTLVDLTGAGQGATESSGADIETLESGQPEMLGPRCVACGTGAIDDDGYCEHCGHKQPAARDHMERQLPGVAAASDRGLRHHRNEDFFAIAESQTADGDPATVAVVCDGVSSATRSDEASATACRTLRDSLCIALAEGTDAARAMRDAVLDAAEAVTALAAEGPNEPSKNSPACTVVSVLVSEGILTVGWVGDSRAYWVPEDRAVAPARLTEDDSWAAQMVAAGLMNEAEAYADRRAHAITGWLGADAYEVEPHTASFRLEDPGVVVVCTDGLWNYAESAEEMASAVPQDAAARPLHSAQHLVGYALDGGGHDNVTVAVVPFPAPPARAGSS